MTDAAVPERCRPRARRLFGLGLGVLVLSVLLGGLSVLRLRRGPRAAAGDLEMPGLSAPVEIVRDSLGIPQIWAASVEDAFFAQGLVHASDRLWQMEQLRRVARGELSEVYGETALDSDRFLRTLGMARAAERAVRELCAECRRRIDAYAAGVNAAVARWQGPLPPEFVVLRIEPSTWTAADVLAIEKIMAWDLADYDIGLLLADAQRRGGQALLDTLLPRYPADGATILEDAPSAPARAAVRVSAGAPEVPSSPLDERVLASGRVPELARALLDGASALRGSNSWVVAGARTRSGKPLLANDMHLNLSVPALWYLVGLHAPGLDVVGMSIPGSPGVVAGHSGAVAWGFTNAMVDDADFFIERPDPTDPNRYLTPGGSEPFQDHTEEIRVRGSDRPIPLRVRATRHGPVMSDVEARAGQDLLALRWAGHDPSPSAEAIFAMNTARTAAEFVRALEGFHDPHQNVVFADTAGTIGYWMAGRIPLRRSGRPPLLPVPGWTDDNEWVGDLPFDQHPHVLDPARGFIVTANNLPAHGPVSALISDGHFEGSYRARRITELLDTAYALDAPAVARMQMDLVSLFARAHQHSAADAYRQAGEVARADSLGAWDGSMAADRREPLLLYTWLEVVRFRVARELYGGAPGYFPMSVLDRMLAAGRVSPATTTSAVKEALANAGASRWGEAHPLHLDHPLQGVRVVGKTLGFGHEPIPIGGDGYTVNLADHSGRFPPFIVRHGPSQRHVVDLGDLDGAGGFILPGGESGFPRGPHAFDQLPAWLSGGLVPLPMRRERAEARGASRTRLVPG
ncbi:MAG: penicillin acylase family protein [Gemmatimonadetes bacterium]|nr:penicillin acylase family protein [Gemmatimonadota bacterium]